MVFKPKDLEGEKMTEEVKQLLKENEELKNRILALEGIKEKNGEKKSYPFSEMQLKKLKKLVDIELNYDNSIFDSWLNNNIKLNNEVEIFLEKLLKEEGRFIKSYNEEDLKMYFISQILNHINFKMIKQKVRFYCEEKLTYEAKNFIFNGKSDFFIARGLEIPEKPYFFIQEFKQKDKNGYPEPQLLAELISAVELNSWRIIKGAYIVGNYWTFVILEKLGINKYQYFTSEDFNSAKIDDLKSIYKNLLFIKKEVIRMVDEGI